MSARTAVADIYSPRHVPLSKFYWQDDWIPFIISVTVRLPREMSELVAVSPSSWLIAELFGSDSRAEKRGQSWREWKYHYTIGWWQFFTPEENKGVKMFWITERESFKSRGCRVDRTRIRSSQRHEKDKWCSRRLSTAIKQMDLTWRTSGIDEIDNRACWFLPDHLITFFFKSNCHTLSGRDHKNQSIRQDTKLSGFIMLIPYNKSNSVNLSLVEQRGGLMAHV